mmetsp:Transcript_90162/g.254282  ORF Transcript_90162/g.254282 Transcript_90162/m.254282 type:complete len:204 (+) Transcript_90162:265-876(+)
MLGKCETHGGEPAGSVRDDALAVLRKLSDIDFDCNGSRVEPGFACRRYLACALHDSSTAQRFRSDGPAADSQMNICGLGSRTSWPFTRYIVCGLNTAMDRTGCKLQSSSASTGGTTGMQTFSHARSNSFIDATGRLKKRVDPQWFRSAFLKSSSDNVLGAPCTSASWLTNSFAICSHPPPSLDVASWPRRDATSADVRGPTSF